MFIPPSIQSSLSLQEFSVTSSAQLFRPSLICPLLPGGLFVLLSSSSHSWLSFSPTLPWAGTSSTESHPVQAGLGCFQGRDLPPSFSEICSFLSHLNQLSFALSPQPSSLTAGPATKSVPLREATTIPAPDLLTGNSQSCGQTGMGFDGVLGPPRGTLTPATAASGKQLLWSGLRTDLEAGEGAQRGGFDLIHAQSPSHAPSQPSPGCPAR